MKKNATTRTAVLSCTLPGVFAFFFAFMTGISPTMLQAQGPQISVQGTLKNAAGTPAPDGTQTVTFRLYDHPTTGTHLWEEKDVEVDIVGGIYSHYLGSTTPLNPAHFANTLYLAVKIGSYELSPRNRLAYAPYAFAVNTAQNALLAEKVTCSGAVGDIKYSILNPTQFADENGACWVPMDGRALATTDKLRIRTGMTNVPNGGGLFIRAQEFSNSDNDPDRDSNAPIAQIQQDTFQLHFHKVSQLNIQQFKSDGSDNEGEPDFDRGDGTEAGNWNVPPSDETSKVGHTETRPKNQNFWVYIRIN
jgi:hypothetical protein